MKIKIYTILILGIFLSIQQVIAQQDSDNDPIILLSSKMLKDTPLNIQLINSFDVTPRGEILLSTVNQFYLLKWEEIIPLDPKMEKPINSFTYTSDNLLVVISNNTLCYMDQFSQLVELYKLPNKNMGISAGDSTLYVYDKATTKTEQKYVVYMLQNNQKHLKLAEFSTPIISVVEVGKDILITTENKILSANIETKQIEVIINLPDTVGNIISMTRDFDNDIIYFSTNNAIYLFKDGEIYCITNDFTGVVRYYPNQLFVFDAKKSFLILLETGNSENKTTDYTSKIELDTIADTPYSPQTDNPSAISPIVEPIKPDQLHPSSLEIQAIDYVTPLKGLVAFFNNQRSNFVNQVNKWTNELNPRIKTMNANYNKILKIEAELKNEKNKNIRGTSKTIKDLQKKLKEQRKAYNESVKYLRTEGGLIINQLKAHKKQELVSIHDKFKDVILNVVPKSELPALSQTQTNIIFSNRTDSLQTISYLKPANELFYWYQNVEHSFYQIIKNNNQNAERIIEKDRNLETKLNAQKNQLSEYRKEPKKYKEMIKALKKEISCTENERKEQLKQMKSNSNDLSNQLKSYEKEIKQAFKEKVKNVVEGINYLFKQTSEK